MKWSARYVGIPFEYGGRGPHVFDCWGLVRDVYLTELGIYLPTYDVVSAKTLRDMARAINGGKDGSEWKSVSTPRPFDVIVMSPHGHHMAAHVGIMVTPDTLLHAERDSHACILRIRHFTVRNRIVGFRRHISQV